MWEFVLEAVRVGDGVSTSEILSQLEAPLLPHLFPLASELHSSSAV